MESAAGQVSPAGESVAELLARIGRQAGLIREYRDLLVADLIAKTGRDSQLLQAAVLGRAWYAG